MNFIKSTNLITIRYTDWLKGIKITIDLLIPPCELVISFPKMQFALISFKGIFISSDSLWHNQERFAVLRLSAKKFPVVFLLIERIYCAVCVARLYSIVKLVGTGRNYFYWYQDEFSLLIDVMKLDIFVQIFPQHKFFNGWIMIFPN